MLDPIRIFSLDHVYPSFFGLQSENQTCIGDLPLLTLSETLQVENSFCQHLYQGDYDKLSKLKNFSGSMHWYWCTTYVIGLRQANE